MESLKETTGLYEVERRVRYAERPDFRITELQISPTQEEEVPLTPGQTYSVPSKRPHRVANAGDVSAVFFVLQGIGTYDFCPLPGPALGICGFMLLHEADIRREIGRPVTSCLPR